MSTHLIPPVPDALEELQARLATLLAQGRQRQAASKALEAASDVIQRRHIEAANRLAERMAWKPVASVAFFEVQICSNCGEIHQVFRGFATKMERKHDAVERYVAAPCLDQGLPQEYHHTESPAPYCISCINEVMLPHSPTKWKFNPSPERLKD